jgi:hypothetical protein
MEDAVARRVRLKALRASADASGAVAAEERTAAAADLEKPVLKFRNYAVQDKKIEHEKVKHRLACRACGSSSSSSRRRQLGELSSHPRPVEAHPGQAPVAIAQCWAQLQPTLHAA